MAPWPRAPVIPQLVDRKTFRDNRWVRHLSLTSCTHLTRVRLQDEIRGKIWGKQYGLGDELGFLAPRTLSHISHPK
ncbi:hypothetical protein TNCV_3567401 [Trichonephila clavipes]|nr:hypothetical protein TNCV_3567401 [Trichonephila clavipes]